MSVFTSRVTKTLSVPHDPEHTVIVRKLAPRHLEAAARVSQQQSIDDFKSMGGAAFLKELEAMKKPSLEQADQVAAAKDPLLLFDRLTLIEKGVLSWSYDAPIAAESYADLDEETRDFLAREILRLARPALFQTPTEAETDRKNA